MANDLIAPLDKEKTVMRPPRGVSKSPLDVHPRQGIVEKKGRREKSQLNEMRQRYSLYRWPSYLRIESKTNEMRRYRDGKVGGRGMEGTDAPVRGIIGDDIVALGE